MDYRTKAFVNLIPKEKMICGKCGKLIDIENCHIHHKDGKRYNSNIENLELQCLECHKSYTSEAMINTSFRLPAALLQTLDEKSIELGVNMSVLVRHIISEKLGIQTNLKF